FHFFHEILIPSDHEVELAVSSLWDARGHEGLDHFSTLFGSLLFDLSVRIGADGGAIDKNLTTGADEEVIMSGGEYLKHSVVVRDDSYDDVRVIRDIGERETVPAFQFIREGGGQPAIDIVNAGYLVTAVLKSACHVGAHTPESDYGYFVAFHF